MSERLSLLIDQGNTFIKYTFLPIIKVFNKELAEELSQDLPQACRFENLLAELQNTADFDMVDDVYICSVKNAEEKRRLITEFESTGKVLHFAKTQANQFGISNSYAVTSNMGADRWLGIIAGASFYNGDYLVIDAGTAITVDAVVDSKHIGGWICSGISTSTKALLQNTQRVFADSQNVEELAFGQDTPVCVSHGALAQALGIVAIAVQLMKKRSSAFRVIISGGDSSLIYDNLPEEISPNAILVKNIVLIGLARIANERFDAQ